MSNAAPTQTRLTSKPRLAFVVTHPIQYYVPLYQRLAQRDDLDIRVFFTCHDGSQACWDSGFERPVVWDLPLRDGYDFELVPNVARKPGSDRFWGVRNSGLAKRVLAWRPDAVHVTGYPYASHLRLLATLRRRRVPIMFRGDSHLLSRRAGWKTALRQAVLPWVYRCPDVFLYVGTHNRAYYEAFGVPSEKLVFCPHSIDVDRFAEPSAEFERAAATWRAELGLANDRLVLLFAGKFEPKKQPLALMRAIAASPDPRLALIMLGDGMLREHVLQLSAENPQRFRVLPFQNQVKMPVAYRLGDLLVLPSSHDETWGLAVNEAFACGRPALVSDQVGCAPELIRPEVTGESFRANDWSDFHNKLARLTSASEQLIRMRPAVTSLIANFSIAATERSLVEAFQRLVRRQESLLADRRASG